MCGLLKKQAIMNVFIIIIISVIIIIVLLCNYFCYCNYEILYLILEKQSKLCIFQKKTFESIKYKTISISNCFLIKFRDVTDNLIKLEDVATRNKFGLAIEIQNLFNFSLSLVY